MHAGSGPTNSIYGFCLRISIKFSVLPPGYLDIDRWDIEDFAVGVDQRVHARVPEGAGPGAGTILYKKGPKSEDADLFLVNFI